MYYHGTHFGLLGALGPRGFLRLMYTFPFLRLPRIFALYAASCCLYAFLSLLANE